jgi:hypothetical protein
MKPLIYYAHSKLDYNTKREKEEIKFLSQYYKVFNPNTELGELGTIGSISARSLYVSSCCSITA